MINSFKKDTIKMKCIKVVATSIVLLGFSNLTFATSGTTTKVVECSTITNSVDYGNATGQEASACHDTPYWQRLGKTWNADTTQPEETNLSTNDGVSWVTSADGGATWVDNGELTSGGLVKFQFDVTRAMTGNHKYDLLKSWVDWNQDGSWDESEDIITKKWWKHKDSEGNRQLWDDLDQDLVDNNWANNTNREGTWNYDLGKLNSQDTEGTFFSDILTIPVLDSLKDIWMRARVVCENSLQSYSDSMNLIATGYQHQGEVEDYKLAVAKTSDPIGVPEPSTLLIFTIGLLTLAARRKKS